MSSNSCVQPSVLIGNKQRPPRFTMARISSTLSVIVRINTCPNEAQLTAKLLFLDLTLG